jgi:hypothetical protein
MRVAEAILISDGRKVCTFFNKMEEGCIAGCRQTKAGDTVVIASDGFS